MSAMAWFQHLVSFFSSARTTIWFLTSRDVRMEWRLASQPRVSGERWAATAKSKRPRRQPKPITRTQADVFVYSAPQRNYPSVRPSNSMRKHSPLMSCSVGKGRRNCSCCNIAVTLIDRPSAKACGNSLSLRGAEAPLPRCIKDNGQECPFHTGRGHPHSSQETA